MLRFVLRWAVFEIRPFWCVFRTAENIRVSVIWQSDELGQIGHLFWNARVLYYNHVSGFVDRIFDARHLSKISWKNCFFRCFTGKVCFWRVETKIWTRVRIQLEKVALKYANGVGVSGGARHISVPYRQFDLPSLWYTRVMLLLGSGVQGVSPCTLQNWCYTRDGGAPLQKI